MTSLAQDKQTEIKFFDAHAANASYNVFTPQSNEQLIDAIVRLGQFGSGSRVADLGCGSGVFAALLEQRGCHAVGLDISPKLIEIGRQTLPNVEFLEGDVESLPFSTASFDGILLSGIVHHLPDPKPCAAEVFRVLRPGGRFVAFDPNRMNPFMWLYRDRSSPFYSSVGVTANERPVFARAVAEAFRAAGFTVNTEYLSNLRYRYIGSSRLRWLLPVYNALDGTLFMPNFMRAFRSFVLTIGVKP
jgi:ubiquinone/menaquinone biosynthesis C-methylase UbiE